MENNKFTLNQGIFDLLSAIDEAIYYVAHDAFKKDIHIKGPNIYESQKEYYSNMYGDKRRYI